MAPAFTSSGLCPPCQEASARLYPTVAHSPSPPDLGCLSPLSCQSSSSRDTGAVSRKGKWAQYRTPRWHGVQEVELGCGGSRWGWKGHFPCLENETAKMLLSGESCLVMSDSLRSHGLYSAWNSSGQNTGVGSHSLQGILPTQGWDPGLLHCRRILYQLSHQGSPMRVSIEGL